MAVTWTSVEATTTHVNHERAEDGSWELARAAPAPLLRGYVLGYTGFVETFERPLRRRELPTERVPLIINLGVPLAIEAPGYAAVSHADSFVARVSALPAVTEFVGTSAGIQVDFTPLGAHMFLALAMDELQEPVASLPELLGSEGERLTERLRDAAGWEARFELLDRVIARRFARARAPSPSVEWAWEMLRASGGRVEIGRLAKQLGCSRKHLIAGFREQVGVPPKTAARILRLERAAGLLLGRGWKTGWQHEGQGLTPARVAAESGYADQAHMTREFRKLAGTTPAAYAAASQPGMLGVPDQKVNSVQDVPA